VAACARCVGQNSLRNNITNRQCVLGLKGEGTCATACGASAHASSSGEIARSCGQVSGSSGVHSHAYTHTYIYTHVHTYTCAGANLV
jgi:hypothetical protein